MAAWCLPPNLANDFLAALKDGRLSPERLMSMSSEERRTAFAEIVGEEEAHEVNAQFESKLLLKDQKRGLVSWAKRIGGISEPVRRDILARIERMDKVLQPEDEQSFLADLAAKKLGVTVTSDEAKTIYGLAQTAEAAKQAMAAQGWTKESGTAYGRALINLNDYIESLKPKGQTFAHTLIDVLNIPKSALTSVFHLSAPFVQGWGMISTREAWEGFGQMFQYFADEDNYQDLNAYIIGHPDYELAVDGDLGLTKLGDKLSAREEAIQSTLVERANEWLSEKTGVPNLVRASSRAFTGYLNYVRFSRFVDLLNAARLHGEDVSLGSDAVSDLAAAVNDFTGRGELGPDDRFASAGPVLNTLFFSPRKIAATVSMFNPVNYLNPALSRTARLARMRQLAGSLIATGAVLAIAKAMGAQVDPDPRSSNFAKVQIGGEKLDMTGGNSSYVRLLARVITNREITTSGKNEELGARFGSPTRASLIADYMRGKLSPVASFVADALYGKDPVGRPFSLTQEMMDKLMPITVGDFINFAMNDPKNTAAIFPALSAVFGVGLQSPLPPMSRAGLNVWGQPLSDLAIGTPSSWRDDPVNREFQELRYTPQFPMNTIRGVKLTDQQYHDYVLTSGQLAHMRLTQLIGMSGWEKLPPQARLSVMKDAIKTSRREAANAVMLKSQGSAHDILREATAAKQAAAAVPVG